MVALKSSSPVSVSDLNATLPGRAERLLTEKRAAELWSEAQKALVANRQKSLDRLRADLERKYLGQARDKAIDVERSFRVVDDQEWEEVLRRTRTILDRYVAQRSKVVPNLSARIGFPDSGAALPRRRREDFYYDTRKKIVDDLRAEDALLSAQIESEIARVMKGYEVNRIDREKRIADLDLAAEREALARAESEAQVAVRGMMGQVNASLPSLEQRLMALNAAQYKGVLPLVRQPNLPTQTVTQGLDQEMARKYAIVFSKARGWLLTDSPAARDATEEFLVWLEKNAATR
jgi:hypothetical protein